MTQLDYEPGLRRHLDPDLEPHVQRLIERYLDPGSAPPLVPPPGPRHRSLTRTVLALLLLATLALAAVNYVTLRDEPPSPRTPPRAVRPTALASAGSDVDPLTALPPGILRVPWLNQTLAPTDDPRKAVTLPTALTGAEGCARDQLRLAPVASSAAGTTYGQLLVQNVSGTPCQLVGRPGVRFFDASGRVVRRSRFNSGGTGRAVLLVPRSWAVAELGAVASSICGSTSSDRVSVILPQGGGLITAPFSVGGPATGGCPAPVNYAGVPLEVTAFGPTPNPVPPGATVTPVSALTVTVLSPGEVRGGDPLRYVVLVRNPTAYNAPIGGYLCPTYRQELFARGRFTGNWLLNCAGAGGSIPARQTIAFDMELPVPAAAGPSDNATISWQFFQPQGAIATGRLRLT